MDGQNLYDKVRDHYSSAAKASNSDDNELYGQKVAAAFGYSEEELASIPRDANLGLSCGNPLALAKLREGETVVDLGSGAGFDAFLAAKNVGESGKVIGVDMNKDMLERANRNKERSNVGDNVSFVESSITEMKLDSGVADCIISNCVVNLVPESDKQLVFNEMARVLKPGGRVAISDILTKKDLTPELKESIALYVGCISGASRVEAYEKYLRDAGFSDVLIVDTNSDLNVYMTAMDDGEGAAPCCGPKPTETPSSCGPKNTQAVPCCGPDSSKSFIDGLKTDFKDVDFNEWAGSFKIYAVKA